MSEGHENQRRIASALDYAHERREKLINLNKLEVVLACIVAIIAITAAAGTWFVLPYRVAATEEALKEQAKEMSDLKKQQTDTHELLVRIEERVKQVQETLRRENSQQ